MERYTYIHNKIWTDGKFRKLDQDGKMLVLYILTSPHCNMIGYYRMPLLYAAADLGWEPDRLRAAFSVVEQSGMVRYDPESDVVLIPNFLKYNRLSNPNQAKAASAAIQKLPANTLLPIFLAAVREYCAIHAGAFERQWPIDEGDDEISTFADNESSPEEGDETITETVTLTVPETVTQTITPNTEYRVQSTDLSSPNGDSSVEPDGGCSETDCSPTNLVGESKEGRSFDPVRFVMDEYNRIFAPFWKRPLSTTKKRRNTIKARLRTFTPEQLVEAMEGIRASPFHMGQNDRNSFYADPEFVFRSDEKVEEWLNRKKPSKGTESASQYDHLW